MKCIPLALSVLMMISTCTFAADTAWLSKGPVMAQVSKDYPLVLKYERTDGSASFDGAVPDARWTITVIKPDRTFAAIPAEGVQVKADIGQDKASYTFTGQLGGQTVVTFTIAIAVEADEVTYRLMDVKPAEGYKLRQIDFAKSLRVALPAAAPKPTVCGGTLGRERGAYFLENPVQSAPRSARSLDMIILGQEKAAAAAYDNLPIRPWMFQSGQKNEAAAEFWCPPYVYTVAAGAGENYTTGETDPFVARIGIVGDRNGDGEVNWCDGAGFINACLPGQVPLHQDYLQYDAGDDFENFIDVVRKLYYFTDGRPMICLHAGWQYWSWDSEYPAYMEPNDELGGRAALYKLMREGAKYRCYVSLIHNWDDAYKHSPAWREDLIMRNQDQALHEATAWAGGRSFINGPFKMVKLGWAKQVADGLVAQGARVRMFSDVLSAVPEREDYDKNMPSDALANLVLGKFQIIKILKEHGIEALGSESVTWPFVGRLCTAHSMPLGISEDPKDVPLGPLVLHSKMAYQGGSGPASLLAGVDNYTGWDNDKLYLWSFVLSQYADRPMTNFIRRNNVLRSEFGKDTFVEWNRSTGQQRVVVAGQLIFNGGASLTPKKTPNVYLAYSRFAKPQIFPAPKGWTDGSKLLVYKLGVEPEQKVAADGLVTLEGGQLELNLPARTPFRICYGQDAYERDKIERETPFAPPTITWPEDKLLQATPEGPRPSWVRKATRQNPPGATLYVGCGAKFPTEEASRKHAAEIIACKVSWEVRGRFVSRSRDYENRLNLRGDDINFDNWNLGIDEPHELFAPEKLAARAGTQWYVEKLEDNNPQLTGDKPHIAYKVFAATPVTAKELHDIYVLAIRNQLEKAKKSLENGQGNRTKLENGIKLWSFMLEEESKKDN